jgi:hypothetical protein
MKFVLAYTTRDGANAEDNLKSAESAQKLLANWTPSPSGNITEWVQRVDGGGGFAVVTTDNSADLMRDLSSWGPWLNFEVFPVLDVLEATAINEEAIHIASAVL